MSGHCLLQKQSPFSCAWPNKRRRPRNFVIWRVGCSGRQVRRRECREKGFSFSELARQTHDLLSSPGLEGGGVVSLCTPIAHRLRRRSRNFGGGRRGTEARGRAKSEAMKLGARSQKRRDPARWPD
jgi:hypothetical protein